MSKNNDVPYLKVSKAKYDKDRKHQKILGEKFKNSEIKFDFDLNNTTKKYRELFPVFYIAVYLSLILGFTNITCQRTNIYLFFCFCLILIRYLLSLRTS